jgi:hypothetical protein
MIGSPSVGGSGITLSTIAIFFKTLGAFNIGWYDGVTTKAISYVAPPIEELLTKEGMDNFDGDHSENYRHILTLK